MVRSKDFTIYNPFETRLVILVHSIGSSLDQLIYSRLLRLNSVRGWYEFLRGRNTKSGEVRTKYDRNYA